MQQTSSVVFSIVAVRGVVVADVVKKAIDSKLEDIVYRTSLSFSDDLDASRLQMLVQLQSADVQVSIGQSRLSVFFSVSILAAVTYCPKDFEILLRTTVPVISKNEVVRTRCAMTVYALFCAFEPQLV